MAVPLDLIAIEDGGLHYELASWGRLMGVVVLGSDITWMSIVVEMLYYCRMHRSILHILLQRQSSLNKAWGLVGLAWNRHQTCCQASQRWMSSSYSMTS